MVGFEKKIVVAMLIISVFVMIVAVSSLYIQIQIESGSICGCAIPLYIFVPFLSSIGFFIGTLIYYLLRPVGEKRIKIDEIITYFLDKDEGKVVREIIRSGKITQASLMKRTGFDKVKIFRIVEKLRKKGVIVKEPYGKTNIIRLSENISKMIEKC